MSPQNKHPLGNLPMPIMMAFATTTALALPMAEAVTLPIAIMMAFAITKQLAKERRYAKAGEMVTAVANLAMGTVMGEVATEEVMATACGVKTQILRNNYLHSLITEHRF